MLETLGRAILGTEDVFLRKNVAADANQECLPVF
jgi:hypothetical protein